MKLKDDRSLSFSTLFSRTGYVGGSTGIAVDAAGNVTLAGNIGAANLHEPLDFLVTPGAFQTTAVKLNRGTATSGFVTKLDASGSSLLYSTYFGGSSYDGITRFAVDPTGNVVFSGYSYFSGFAHDARCLATLPPSAGFQLCGRCRGRFYWRTQLRREKPKICELRRPRGLPPERRSRFRASACRHRLVR